MRLIKVMRWFLKLLKMLNYLGFNDKFSPVKNPTKPTSFNIDGVMVLGLSTGSFWHAER